MVTVHMELNCLKSGPARGLWIEIRIYLIDGSCTMSGPASGLWIEIINADSGSTDLRSGPARGLWIEIRNGAPTMGLNCGGPRKGPVD